MDRKPRQFIPFLLTIGILVATPTAHSAYTITDLGASDAMWHSSLAYDINNNGLIVGTFTSQGSYTDTVHAFSYDNDVVTSIGNSSPSKPSAAYGVNASGQVVGFNTFDDGSVRGYILNNGVISKLGTLGGTSSTAFGINDAGLVVGRARTSGNADHPFLYNDGVITDLGTLGGSAGYAYRINNSGQIVGSAQTTGNAAWQAFLWSNGVMTGLGTLGGNSSIVKDINDNGQIVGWAATPGNASNHAYLWSNGVMSDLGTLGGNSYAYSINANGQIVGQFTPSITTGMTPYGILCGYCDHAILWNNGSMMDLNYVEGVIGSNWLLKSATGINDNGQIVGTGLYVTSDGTSLSVKEHIYLLTPTAVPEPETYAMMLAGLGLVGWAARRRR